MAQSLDDKATWWVLSRSANPQPLRGFALRRRPWPGPTATSTSTSDAPAAQAPEAAGPGWRQLNDIERSWRDLKRHYLAHRTFRDAGQLDLAVHEAIHALGRDRQAAPCAPISRAA